VPKDVVAKAAWEALGQFDQVHRGGAAISLKTVRFVNIDMESTQVFVSEFNQRRQRDVTKQQFTSPGSSDVPGGSVPNSDHPDADKKLTFMSNCQVSVEVYRGDLLSERVDAIVCSVNSRLDLDGGAARAISGAAGDSFVQECMDYVSKCGRLQVTEVTHASSGQLQPRIQYVMLAVGPTQGRYRDATSFHMALIDTFYNCLLYANNTLKIRSVSIPTISSGKLCKD